MINLSLKGSQKSKNAMKKLAKRICFKDNRHIRIINKGGMDCIVDFITGQKI